jgi:hypothetical protein
MRNWSRSRYFLSTIILTVLLSVFIPTSAFGQGHGRGRGHGNNGIFGDSHNKCGKFVNCHDARDGRWDGRGPRRNRTTSIWRNRRVRDRILNNDNNWVRNRRYRRNHN